MVESPVMPETRESKGKRGLGDWILPKKVASYPTVQATYEGALRGYCATKEWNSVTQFTAGVAERAAGAVAQPLLYVSLPLLNRFEPTLQQLDTLAAGQLARLEERAPLMTEEPGVILEAARERTVSGLNQSYVGQALNYALQPVIGAAERLTPTIYEEQPPTQGEESRKGEEAEGEDEELTLQQTVRRVYNVGSRLQQRALERALNNVSSLRKRSQESLDSLRRTVDLIQYFKELEEKSGAGTIRDFFSDILEDGEEGRALPAGAKGESGKPDMNKRTLLVSRNLTRKLKCGYESTMVHAKPYLTESLFIRLEHGQTLLEGIHRSFSEAKTLKDVSDSWIDSTRKQLDYLSSMLNEISLRSAMAYWLGKEQDDSESVGGDSTTSYTPSESLDEDCDVTEKAEDDQQLLQQNSAEDNRDN